MSNAFIFTIFNKIKTNLFTESFYSFKLVLLVCHIVRAQLTFACLKATKETPEIGVKYVQS